MFGVLARIIDRPSQAMDRAVAQSRSWLLAALLLAITLLAQLWVSAPYQVELANETSQQMIERVTANMTEQQAQAVRESARPTTINQYLLISGLGGIAMMAIGWVVRAGVIHFSATALGGTSHWGGTYATTVWSMFPFAMRSLVMMAWVLVNKSLLMHQGLSFLVASGDLLANSRSVAYVTLASIDPFVIWHLVLLAIGVHAATKVGRGKAAVLAVVVWALLLGLTLVPVLVSSAIMGRAGL